MHTLCCHRITEWCRLEGNKRSSSSNSLLPWAGIHSSGPGFLVSSNQALNTSRVGVTKALLGNIFQNFTCTLRNFFLISNLDLPSFCLKPPCSITAYPCMKSLSSFLVAPLGTGRWYKFSSETSSCWTTPCLSQPFFTAEVLQCSPMTSRNSGFNLLIHIEMHIPVYIPSVSHRLLEIWNLGVWNSKRVFDSTTLPTNVVTKHMVIYPTLIEPLQMKPWEAYS